jgi:hypothetical protein
MGLNSKCTRLFLPVTATSGDVLRQRFHNVTYFTATRCLPRATDVLLLRRLLK